MFVPLEKKKRNLTDNFILISLLDSFGQIGPTRRRVRFMANTCLAQEWTMNLFGRLFYSNLRPGHHQFNIRKWTAIGSLIGSVEDDIDSPFSNHSLNWCIPICTTRHQRAPPPPAPPMGGLKVKGVVVVVVDPRELRGSGVLALMVVAWKACA